MDRQTDTYTHTDLFFFFFDMQLASILLDFVINTHSTFKSLYKKSVDFKSL